MACDLEYLAGVVKGDGTLYYNKKAYEHVVEVYDRELAFVEMLAAMLRECGYNPSVRSYGTYYRVRVNSYALYTTLVDLIQRLLTNPTPQFVAGLFDSDGTLYFDKRKKRPLPILELANTDVSVVLAASKLFEEFGIRHSIKRSGGRKKPVYKTVVRGLNVYLALNILNLKHPKFFA